MAMTPTAEIATLTRHFGHLQGLRWVPVGLAAIVAAAIISTRATSGLLWTVLLLLVAAIMAGDVAVDRYYARELGLVRDRRPRRLATAAARVAAVALVVAAGLLDVELEWPVLLSGFVVGALLVAFWAATGRGRAHWPALAVLPFAAAFGPLAGLTDPGRDAIAVLLVVAGVVEIVGGVLDHRSLRARLAGIRDAAG
jgi:hypothetical protein